jgi:integrase
MKMPAKYVPRQRVLTYKELKTVWKAADHEGYPFGTFLKMLILTGQRTAEINSLRFDYIDTEQRSITLPETKNGRKHTFPYGEILASVLREIPRKEGYLFPGRDLNKPYAGGGKQKWQLDRKLTLEPWTLHDLRRTFATNLAELRIVPHVIERLLNHSSGTISGVAAIYNRFQYVDEMRAAIVAMETRLTSLLLS